MNKQEFQNIIKEEVDKFLSKSKKINNILELEEAVNSTNISFMDEYNTTYIVESINTDKNVVYGVLSTDVQGNPDDAVEFNFDNIKNIEEYETNEAVVEDKSINSVDDIKYARSLDKIVTFKDVNDQNTEYTVVDVDDNNVVWGIDQDGNEIEFDIDEMTDINQIDESDCVDEDTMTLSPDKKTVIKTGATGTSVLTGPDADKAKQDLQKLGVKEIYDILKEEEEKAPKEDTTDYKDIEKNFKRYLRGVIHDSYGKKLEEYPEFKLSNEMSDELHVYHANRDMEYMFDPKILATVYIKYKNKLTDDDIEILDAVLLKYSTRKVIYAKGLGNGKWKVQVDS